MKNYTLRTGISKNDPEPIQNKNKELKTSNFSVNADNANLQYRWKAGELQVLCFRNAALRVVCFKRETNLHLLLDFCEAKLMLFNVVVCSER
jgi:hypothetical protein